MPCFLGYELPCEGPPRPRPLRAGSGVCSKNFVGVSKIWAPFCPSPGCHFFLGYKMLFFWTQRSAKMVFFFWRSTIFFKDAFFLRYKIFWDTKNFFWDTRNFFGDTFFLGYEKLFAESGQFALRPSSYKCALDTSHFAISIGPSVSFPSSCPVTTVDTSIFTHSDGGIGENTPSGPNCPSSSVGFRSLHFLFFRPSNSFGSFHVPSIPHVPSSSLGQSPSSGTGFAKCCSPTLVAPSEIMWRLTALCIATTSEPRHLDAASGFPAMWTRTRSRFHRQSSFRTSTIFLELLSHLVYFLINSSVVGSSSLHATHWDVKVVHARGTGKALNLGVSSSWNPWAHTRSVSWRDSLCLHRADFFRFQHACSKEKKCFLGGCIRRNSALSFSKLWSHIFQ